MATFKQEKTKAAKTDKAAPRTMGRLINAGMDKDILFKSSAVPGLSGDQFLEAIRIPLTMQIRLKAWMSNKGSPRSSTANIPLNTGIK